MSRYARDTTVTPEKSRAEIEHTLTRYGADSFGYGWDGDQAVISFRFDGRTVRFLLTMPDRNDRRFTHTEERQIQRDPEAAIKAWSKACRQAWRALVLIVKAKLEAVESGIVTFDEEFLPYLVLPDGSTVAQQALPMVRQAYETGRMPVALLPGLGETS